MSGAENDGEPGFAGTGSGDADGHTFRVGAFRSGDCETRLTQRFRSRSLRSARAGDRLAVQTMSAELNAIQK